MTVYQVFAQEEANLNLSNGIILSKMMSDYSLYLTIIYFYYISHIFYCKKDGYLHSVSKKSAVIFNLSVTTISVAERKNNGGFPYSQVYILTVS